MNSQPDRHSVRKIVLPSGRSIEVVRFHELDKQSDQGLHICPACESDLVQPTEWMDADDERWELTLECPNCDWSAHGVYEREEIDQLEEKLDDGLVQMLNDLQRLTQANMADEVERFAAALHANVILPEDF